MNQYRKTKEYHRRLSRSELFNSMIHIEDDKEMPEYTDRDIIGLVTDNVLAPALNGFVVWVLHQAVEKQVKRLYFLARDGYFMYRTALQYVQVYELPIECRYLYCSRYSVRIPAYHLDEEKALGYITLGGMNVTAESIYRRAGLDRRQRECLFEETILPYEKSRQIPRRELPGVRDKLKENPLFMKFLRENSRKALPLYEQYLRQEGLLDEVPSALVDSGWVGSMQKELAESLCRLGRKKPLIGFYWGLYEIPMDMDRRQYHTYFFPPEGKTGRKAVFNNCLFETVFTAPHGMTLGYQDCGGKIEPVLSVLQADRMQRLNMIEEDFANWQERFLRQSRNETFQNLAKAYEERRTFQTIAENLIAFMHHPTKEEAQAFGKMDFTDDVLEVEGNHIAAAPSIRRSAWYEGSISVVRRYPAYYIMQYTVYRYLLYCRQTRRYVKREQVR